MVNHTWIIQQWIRTTGSIFHLESRWAYKWIWCLPKLKRKFRNIIQGVWSTTTTYLFGLVGYVTDPWNWLGVGHTDHSLWLLRVHSSFYLKEIMVESWALPLLQKSEGPKHLSPKGYGHVTQQTQNWPCPLHPQVVPIIGEVSTIIIR